MALTPLQTTQKNWERRASVFRNAGISDSVWQGLYNRDMEGVYGGSQGMSDAEIFTGIQSAVHGPQIQDPQAQHGHGGILSGILDTVGNIPHDVAGIITGFPAGIAHLVAHLPSEVTNTGELLAHLAEGDNKWLQQKGYLAPGDKLHESWSDFGTILRAMGHNGNKQLLPYLPFIADLANMTSGQGRQFLMQHPVGAMLDVLPGVAKAGKMATAGRDFTATDSRLAGVVSGEKRFYAAGRALQKGNPVKALVSATGDLIPGGRDAFMQRMTLRQRVNHLSSVSGLDMKSVRHLAGPYAESTQEIGVQAAAYASEKFGDPMLMSITPERREFVMKVSAGVNPDTGELFKSVEEQAQYRLEQMSAEENAMLDVAKNVSEEQRQADLARGSHVMFTDTERQDYMVSKRSPIAQSWGRYLDAREQYYAKAMDHEEQKASGGTTTLTKKQIDAAFLKMKQKHQMYLDTKATHLPPEAQIAALQQVRNMAKTDAETLHDAGFYSSTQLSEALRVIMHSNYIDDFQRLMGPAKTEQYVKDAVRMWNTLQQRGVKPLYIRSVEPTVVNRLIHPVVDPRKLHTPAQDRNLVKGVFFGPSIMDVTAALTYTHVETLRQLASDALITTHIEPMFVRDKAQIHKEYVDGLIKARQAGHLKLTDTALTAMADNLYKANYDDWNPESFGLRRAATHQIGESRAIEKNAAQQLRVLTGVDKPALSAVTGNKIIRSGTSLYKFSVLTGPRHLAHVGLGGLAFMMGRVPFAPTHFLTAARLMRGEVSPEVYGLQGLTLSGLRGRVYEVGRTDLEKVWHHGFGAQLGQDLAAEGIHEAKQKAIDAATYIPNKLAKLEETIMDMYRVSAFLSYRGKGLATDAALEQAHKVFVDINNMSVMERTVIKQLFPFYAFTRHLFRYLFTYPVDYPVRAAIMSNFGESEQQDWTNGLPRSYMSLFWLGQPDTKGNVVAIDTKNVNPFRSFANDFSFAGFFSSLTPFLTGPLNAVGVDTLSGTTQLYPGVSYNPQTGSLQATPPPGGLLTLAESFVPQVGLLDHYLQLSQSTRSLAKFSPLSYRKQLYNMLNMPFVPEVINVPYQQEITEMRRFRAAQAALTTVQKNPSAINIAKLMEWNRIPFNNQLFPPQVLAAYYKAIQESLQKANLGYISPKAVTKAPPKRPATLANF